MNSNAPEPDGGSLPYSFAGDGRSITIARPDLPVPWINYLSNGTMHAFVSQAGGGFAWLDSATLGRLTRYRMHNLPIDSPGFYIYLKNAAGGVWSPSFRPCNVLPDAWSATHRPGSTLFEAEKDGLKAHLKLSILPDHPVLAWDLLLENRSGSAVECDVFAYAELSQMDWFAELKAGYYWEHMLNTWFDEKSQTLFHLYHNPYHPRREMIPLVYFASTEPIKSFSGDRDAFIGNYRDERLPLAVERSLCGNEQILSGNPCAALHSAVSLPASGEKRILYCLGAQPGALADPGAAQARAISDLAALRDPQVVDRQYEKLEAWWSSHLDVFRCSIPDKAAERQINVWSPVNTVHVGRYSRAVNARAPGLRAVGYRDTCQDLPAMAYRKPDWARKTLETLLAHQYEDGHAAMAFDPFTGEIRVVERRSDLHLWLPFAAHAILAETRDWKWLDQPIPFLSADNRPTKKTATIWEHLLAGIQFTESHLGRHGLPLTLGGDWNDTIHVYSEKGRGESVFAGQQYVAALHDMLRIAEQAKPHDTAFLSKCRERQTEALQKHAWGGSAWLRCFDDEGAAIGEDNLYLNPQSWAVIAAVGGSSQWKRGMDQVHARLNTDIGLKLLEHGLETWPVTANPKTGYNPGCGENGAIFCHANTWAMIAEALLGRGERAWEYFLNLLPHNQILKNGIDRYRSEPYAWVSNIVGSEHPRFGYGNVSHITGTAAWADVAATQYLLGIRPTLSGLLIDPCIPPGWKRFCVNRHFMGREFRIRVSNPDGCEKGVRSIQWNGREVLRNPDGSLPVEPFGEEKVIHLEATL